MFVFAHVHTPDWVNIYAKSQFIFLQIGGFLIEATGLQYCGNLKWLPCWIVCEADVLTNNNPQI